MHFGQLLGVKYGRLIQSRPESAITSKIWIGDHVMLDHQLLDDLFEDD